MHRYLVLGYSTHGYLLERYWLIRESTMWRVRAMLQRDWSIWRIEVIELAQEQEAQAS